MPAKLQAYWFFFFFFDRKRNFIRRECSLLVLVTPFISFLMAIFTASFSIVAHNPWCSHNMAVVEPAVTTSGCNCGPQWSQFSSHYNFKPCLYCYYRFIVNILEPLKMRSLFFVLDMVSSQLQLHRYHTGRESKVVTALTLLKRHLFKLSFRSSLKWTCSLH